jgi:ABC-type branched-subunit amino acid transport system substrate-binding protein
MSTKRKLVAVAAAGVLIVTACSSSSKSGSGVTGSTAGQTYTIGILTDLSGPAASGSQTSVQGAEAGAVLAAKQGYHFKFVKGDSQTSPAAILAAAKKLVTQDHVDAVIAVSALAFGAAPYLTAQGIPVVGAAEDGPEWITAKNMFSVYGALDETKVGSSTGAFFKMQGVTTFGALGYSISPSSSESAKGAAVSAQEAGLKVGYLNANFPFGSTNVQPVALAMKSAGVDGFESTTDPNTSFALVSALRQVGHNPKVALLPDGYGGDLIQAGPGALQTGQGVYFTLTFQPVEMHTAATEQFQSALRTIGITNDPTYGEYAGYTSVAMLVRALKAAGPHPSHSALIASLSGLKNFDAAGLLGRHTFDPGDRASTATGIDGCIYVTKLSGSAFQLVPGADPICGHLIPGKTVSPSS